MAKGLIKMERDTPTHPGGPVTADVHPDEVEGMKKHDWRVVEVKTRGAKKTVKDDKVSV